MVRLVKRACRTGCTESLKTFAQHYTNTKAACNIAKLTSDIALGITSNNPSMDK